MSTLDCTPNFITAKSVENARKDTSMERVVGSELETDSELSFFWDEPDSISSVETKKLHHLVKRNSVKKSNSTLVKMSVQNIPPPPQHTKSVHWQYPEYSTFSERYKTFWDWPRFVKGPSTKDLARAGFIYTKISDKVTCFCCGQTLKNWEPRDDAFNEHIRWSKSCYFALMVVDATKQETSKEGRLNKQLYFSLILGLMYIVLFIFHK